MCKLEMCYLFLVHETILVDAHGFHFHHSNQCLDYTVKVYDISAYVLHHNQKSYIFQWLRMCHNADLEYFL